VTQLTLNVAWPLTFFTARNHTAALTAAVNPDETITLTERPTIK
jgi:hypothetical protein